jgi:hypothetical protein
MTVLDKLCPTLSESDLAKAESEGRLYYLLWDRPGQNGDVDIGGGEFFEKLPGQG